MVTFIIIAVSLVWFPHSFMRVEALGYDFTIFYVGPTHEGWAYAPWVSAFFEPLRILPHDEAFLVYYAFCAFCYWLLIRRTIKRFGVLGQVAFLLSLYPYLLGQELGSLTPILALCCCSYGGALLAGAFKPYLLVFAVYHAVFELRRARAARALVGAARLQGESAVSVGGGA